MLNMKLDFSVFAHHHIAFIMLLFLAMLFLMFPISSAAGNETNPGDELISLTVKDEPLGDVLYKVSRATGYDISLDSKWQNFRVTVSLEEVSLHKGLKRILRNLNSAIIYVSSKKIKIIIYDKTASEDTSPTPSADQSFERPPASQRRPYRPSRHRPPTSQSVEKEDSSGSDEDASDTSAVSGQESEIGTPDSEGEENIKPERIKSDPDDETNKDLEDKSSEESPENDNQTQSKNE
jgi:type II secretory pathway component GspD/PulD (secretin)